MTNSQIAYENGRRTKKHLEARGYHSASVERWNTFAKVKNDLFGFADYLAFQAGLPVLLIQTTSKGNMAARRKKIKANAIAKEWLKSGNSIEIHGWYKVGRFWNIKVEVVTL